MSRLLAWLRRLLTGAQDSGPPALPVRMDSPEEYWLTRGRTAAQRCRLVARQARQGAVAQRCRAVADQAGASLATMERLAGQASLLHRTIAGMNRHGLSAEQGRLRAAGGGAGRERSLAAIADQERVAARLEGTQAELLARLEASAMELEGLHAGLAEVVALAETGGDVGAERLEGLAREVEGLRLGLLEAVDSGRVAIEAPREAAAAGIGGLPDAKRGGLPTVPAAAQPTPSPAGGSGSPIVPVTDADVPGTP